MTEVIKSPPVFSNRSSNQVTPSVMGWSAIINKNIFKATLWELHVQKLIQEQELHYSGHTLVLVKSGEILTRLVLKSRSNLALLLCKNFFAHTQFVLCSFRFQIPSMLWDFLSLTE